MCRQTSALIPIDNPGHKQVSTRAVFVGSDLAAVAVVPIGGVTDTLGMPMFWDMANTLDAKDREFLKSKGYQQLWNMALQIHHQPMKMMFSQKRKHLSAFYGDNCTILRTTNGVDNKPYLYRILIKCACITRTTTK
mmetsp:Transcript_46210/g.49840  ORF Transcript_46210/g.49840 Transcript_46210/m.49840 type:complete len:136 (-) Transcript_46210:51-458(-)